MKQRPQRIANIIRRVVGIKLRQLTPGIYLTLTQIEVSADLRHARLWVSALDPATSSQQLQGLLDQYREQLQAELAANLSSKFTPRLELKLDAGYQHANRIDQLLDNLEP